MSLILNGTNGVSDVDGSASTPAIRGTDTNTGMFFPAADTIAFAEGGVESMRLDSSGNVGIGTSSPTGSGKVLQIYDTSIAEMRLTNATSGVTSGDGLTFQMNAANGYIWNYESGFLSLGTSGTERMRIDASGNLLVGATGFVGSGTTRSGLCLFNQDSLSGRINIGKTTSGTRDAIQFNHNGTTVGTVTYSDTATAYVTSSDYRLKENVAPMTGALAKVAQLKPVTYTWKHDGSASQGFIAHELQEVVPECVSGEKDAVNEDGSIKPQGIDTSFLVATLTAAIQELKAELDTVKTELATLKGAA